MYECSEEEMIRDHDLRYVWSCPRCDYEYEDAPNCNEALPCPECGKANCMRTGESYT